MPFIRSVGTAVPKHAFTQEQAKQFARQLFSDAFRDIDRLLPVFDHANIQKRHFAVPLEWFQSSHSFQEKNDCYIEAACELGEEAIQRCLDPLGLTANDIDHLLFVSTTGMATPSIDARLIHRLGMKSTTKRTPIWGLGCAGGAIGLSRAASYAKSSPGERVLLLAIELCGLTFQHGQKTKSNFIATSLFADGAAAVLLEEPLLEEQSRAESHPWLHIEDYQSTLFPDSLDVMGWDITDNGLEVIFSKDIPTIVHSLVRSNIEQFLAKQNLSLADISQYIAHPGGKKVIDAYTTALDLPGHALRHAQSVLSEYGNMSSATVLFVLKAAMELDQGRPGDRSLLTALGPGFSSEVILLQWK